MPTKSQLEVCWHTWHSVHFHPRPFTRPGTVYTSTPGHLPDLAQCTLPPQAIYHTWHSVHFHPRPFTIPGTVYTSTPGHLPYLAQCTLPPQAIYQTTLFDFSNANEKPHLFRFLDGLVLRLRSLGGSTGQAHKHFRKLQVNLSQEADTITTR